MGPLRHTTVAAVVVALAFIAPVVPAAGSGATSALAAVPTRSVTVGGTGVSTFPAYDEAIGRFGIRTTALTNGAIQITATSSDPAATVRLNGRPVAAGTPVAVSGLAVGDEVNVQITNAGGTSNQSFIYLPAGFPTLTAASSGAGPTPGMTFLSLSTFGNDPKYEAIVDTNGVPSYARSTLLSHDLKRQPNGHYSVARGRTPDLDTIYDIVELDAQLRPIGTYTSQGHTNTDFHDSILFPSGGRILMSYEPNPTTLLVDSLVQEVGPGGGVILDWNSAEHMDPAVDGLSGLPDYAHLNSIEVMADGNLLLSFRHTSQVMKIDRTTGDVIWRLGGVNSDFTFPDDPEGGPCAQHTATELANGDIQIWDNGSVAGVGQNKLCPDPSDPDGPRIDRAFSRVTVYHLDDPSGPTPEAHLVDSYLPDEYSPFAGSVYRLGGRDLSDNLFIGTALGSRPDLTQPPIALEVTAAGQTVWTLDAAGGYFSYRSHKAPAPDAIKPVVTVTNPVAGAVYDEGDVVTADFGCTDRGGANLVSCGGPVLSGGRLDTSPGAHSLVVTAADAAGNTHQVSVSYTVRAAYQPDAEVRAPKGEWTGSGVLGGPATQTGSVRTRSHAAKKFLVRVVNRGVRSDQVSLAGPGGNRKFDVRYLVAGRNVTRQVVAGAYRSPALAPGASLAMTVRIKRLRTAPLLSQFTTQITVGSVANPSRTDVVAAQLRPARR